MAHVQHPAIAEQNKLQHIQHALRTFNTIAYLEKVVALHIQRPNNPPKKVTTLAVHQPPHHLLPVLTPLLRLGPLPPLPHALRLRLIRIHFALFAVECGQFGGFRAWVSGE